MRRPLTSFGTLPNVRDRLFPPSDGGGGDDDDDRNTKRSVKKERHNCKIREKNRTVVVLVNFY